MSVKTKPGFWAANPERAMIVMFPLISFSLFLVGAILWWLVQLLLSF
ncbi:hypothetical protein [Vampirovibrio sp.]